MTMIDKAVKIAATTGYSKQKSVSVDKNADSIHPSPSTLVTLSPWNFNNGSEAVHRFSWYSELLSRTLY